jgi:hypothetical protein
MSHVMVHILRKYYNLDVMLSKMSNGDTLYMVPEDCPQEIVSVGEDESADHRHHNNKSELAAGTLVCP